MKPTPRALTTLAMSAVLLGTSGCAFNSSPPERDFDQSETYQIIEDAFHENVEYLEDFPGFHYRGYNISECETPDRSSTGFVRIEITYDFSLEDSESNLVRDVYFERLKDAWDEAGYDVHREDVRDDGEFKSLEARRSDGVNYWYRAWGITSLTIQSGCVRETDTDEPYIPPVGNVKPENDEMHQFKDSDDTPSEDESEEAINPFTN